MKCISHIMINPLQYKPLKSTRPNVYFSTSTISRIHDIPW